MADETRYEGIGKLIYGVQRLGGVEHLLGLEHDARVAPELAAAARELAERHRQLMKPIEEKRALDDPEVDMILRGVPELYTTLVEGLGGGHIGPRG
ncbi:hypothetical protein ACFQ09_22825 [Massilia norwichensis]|jgi:hypothetical protein|uniref:Uncharacterized protein n=1 Tax=Massilia norwichensis TaxID=1442366 RepID=A0ABT2A5B1_9BURK|nr:hypothetical protein [Massilia norwichensis]MCS0589386.1 hypothetical protein [Massilia norwichensis]